LRRERRTAHPDAAVRPGPQGGELLDRVASADDPGVVIGAAAGAGDQHNVVAEGEYFAGHGVACRSYCLRSLNPSA